MSDWKTHLNTLFPEVRLKNTIEVRGADAQGSKLAAALPAFWTGIFYDKQALAEAEALTSDWTFDDVSVTRKEVWQKGLGARFRAGTLQPIAEKALTIAKAGLERRALKNASGEDERAHLTYLEGLVAHGQTPADKLLEGLESVGDLRAEILARCDLRDGT
jgi:glutamate--cysteine ligase